MNDDYTIFKNPAKSQKPPCMKNAEFSWILNKFSSTILVGINKIIEKTEITHLYQFGANIRSSRDVSSASFWSRRLTNMCVMTRKTYPWVAELSFQLKKMYDESSIKQLNAKSGGHCAGMNVLFLLRCSVNAALHSYGATKTDWQQDCQSRWGNQRML